MIQVETFVKLLRKPVKTPGEMEILMNCENRMKKHAKKKKNLEKTEEMVENFIRFFKTLSKKIKPHEIQEVVDKKLKKISSESNLNLHEI